MYFEKKLTKEVNDIPPYSRMILKCLSFCRFYTHTALKQTLNIIHNKRQYHVQGHGLSADDKRLDSTWHLCNKHWGKS